MTAVYGLTSQPGWTERYDITVYQLGWRLGGKGASGRYQTPDGRFANVEHGLHVFGGFYHNAFSVLRQTYEAWPGVPNAVPIPWEQAFLPHDLIHLGNDTKQGWGFVGIKFPHLPGELGIGGVELTPAAIITTVIAWIQEILAGHAILRGGPLTPDADLHETLFERIEEAPVKALAIATDDLIMALENVRDVPVANIAWDGIIALLDTAIIAAKVLRALFPPDKNQLDLLGGLEIMLVTLKGMIIDNVLILGFDVINHMEFTDWLKSHGLADDIAHSAMVRAPYDYAFAYELGDPAKPNIAAGVCLRGMMRLVLTYTGSIFWHLNGGMGEIVFTPLYEVLKQRGVKFQFFTRVESLTLGDDGQHIDQITGKIQAVPKNGPFGYDPLVYYAAGNRKFWPLQPDFSQLVDGETLEWIGTGFENYWLCPKSDTPFTLTRGVDFDLVVLGISVGALPVICADLAKKSPAWNRMLTTQQAVPTYGIQYWMKPSVLELGWDRGETILTAYQEPMSSWGDMSFLLNFETQAPDHTKPKSLAYFCGPMKQAPRIPAPPAPDFPVAEQRAAVQAMSDWANIAIPTLWPDAGPGPGINPDLVYQTVVKANIDPSELYVLSPANTIKDRFTAGGSGIDGLYLAGDWLKTGLDAGAFESAVMSGLQCAQAISGIPIHVYGATDFKI